MTEQTETESALAAMNRAAVTARERAARFGSQLVRWSNGSVILVDPGTNGTKESRADQPASDVDVVSESNEES